MRAYCANTSAQRGQLVLREHPRTATTSRGQGLWEFGNTFADSVRFRDPLPHGAAALSPRPRPMQGPRRVWK